jgi:hypothetical protein
MAYEGSKIGGPPNRSVSRAELRDRQDDLEEALKLFTAVSNRLTEAEPLLSAAVADSERLRHMCDNNPALRAAMTSRRLSIQSVTQDIRGVNFKTSSVSKNIKRIIQSRKSELEDVIQDPELLR